jgi:sec-independent protein translocase protein TatC
MARSPQEDLFEGTKMTFGEHIEELRTALFQAILGLLIGLVVGFYFAADVVKFIQTPLEGALYDYYLVKAKTQAAAEYQGQIPYEMLKTIEREGLTPATMKVSVESLHDILRRTMPELQGSAYAPHQIAAVDVQPGEADELVREWTRQADQPDTPAGFLWTLLSTEQRQRLEKLAKKDQLSEAEVRALAAVLNDLVARPAVHQSPVMQVVNGVDEAMEADFQKLREPGASLSPSESRRWNRLLLTAVFPEWLEPPRVALVDLPFWRPITVQVQSLGAQEVFMIWMKAAFITGLMVAAPWMFYKIWMFVAAGLYPHEKHYVYIYLPFSLLLFLAGTALAFFFVFEPVLNFLFKFNRAMNIDPDPRISEWLSFVLFLPLGFGISFQLPLVMLFLQRIGIFSVELYLSKWRIAILAIFVISMVLTPADPISMLLMACPLSLLYFGGVAMCMWMPKGRNPYSQLQAYEP